MSLISDFEFDISRSRGIGLFLDDCDDGNSLNNVIKSQFREQLLTSPHFQHLCPEARETYELLQSGLNTIPPEFDLNDHQGMDTYIRDHWERYNVARDRWIECVENTPEYKEWFPLFRKMAMNKVKQMRLEKGHRVSLLKWLHTDKEDGSMVSLPMPRFAAPSSVSTFDMKKLQIIPGLISNSKTHRFALFDSSSSFVIVTNINHKTQDDVVVGIQQRLDNPSLVRWIIARPYGYLAFDPESNDAFLYDEKFQRKLTAASRQVEEWPQKTNMYKHFHPYSLLMDQEWKQPSLKRER